MSNTNAIENAEGPDWMKRFLWLYFFLLIFEGAFRKWTMPSLATPLLIIRDPVVLVIYMLALQRGVFPFNGFITTVMVLSFVTFLASLAVGASVVVTLYGFRCNFLHLPLIFILAKVMDYNSVVKLGKVVLWLSIPMGALMVAQFFSTPDAFLNASVGGDAGQMILGNNRVRAAATFSFATGAAQFLAIVTAFLMFGFLKKDVYPRKLVLLSMIASCAGLILSGSRTAVGFVAVVVVVSVVTSFLTGKNMGGSLVFLLIGGLILGIVGSMNFAKEGKGLLGDRFGDNLKDGVFMRAFNSLRTPVVEMLDNPALGHGLASGTLAGNKLMGKTTNLVWKEEEWSRAFYESGPFLGLAFLGMRIYLLVWLGLKAWRHVSEGNTLPLTIYASGAPLMLNGSWAQPTTLGFAIVIAGLSLASANLPRQGTTGLPDAGSEVPKSIRRRRGSVSQMSPYARRLHGIKENDPSDSSGEKP